MPDGFTYADAVDSLLLTLGISWEKDLWESVDGSFDGGTSRLTDAEFNALVPQLLEEGAGAWTNDWDPSPSGMNYTSANAASDHVVTPPRLAVLRAALDFILGFQEGVPETIDGKAIREAVIPAIQQGRMEYHIYGDGQTSGVMDLSLALLAILTPDLLRQTINVFTDGFGTREYVGEFLAGAAYTDFVAIETFIINEFFQKALDTDATHWSVNSVPTPSPDGTAPPWGRRGEYALSGLGIGYYDYCGDATQTLDLRQDVGFIFDYLDNTDNFQSLGSNHGVFTQRVWLAASTVDRAAVVYDWFLQLATRHFAASLDTETRGPRDRARQALAANICLRRAASAALSLGYYLVHETSHNVNLYHCYDPVTFSPMGCLQDVAAYAWQVYAQSRLGAGRTLDKQVSPGPSTSTTTSYWSFDTVSFLGWQTAGDGVPRAFEAVIECDQGDTLGPGGERFAIGLATLVALASPLSPLVAPFVIYLEAIILQSTRIAGEVGLPNENGTLQFVVRRPLIQGSDVAQCCIGRDTLCLSGGRAGTLWNGFSEEPFELEDGPCWQSGEVESAGCCETDTGGNTGGGGTGGPGDPRNVPGLPGPWTPVIPSDDQTQYVLDGVTVWK